MKNIVSTDDSAKRQITDSISENLTDSDLESFNLRMKIENYTKIDGSKFFFFNEKSVLFLTDNRSVVRTVLFSYTYFSTRAIIF